MTYVAGLLPLVEYIYTFIRKEASNYRAILV